MRSVPVSFDLCVQKAVKTGDGTPILTVYATDTSEDRHGERCSDNCLKGLLAQVYEKRVDLLNSHEDGVGMGHVVDAEIVDAKLFYPDMVGVSALVFHIALDFDNPFAKKLFEDVRQGLYTYGFSVGGTLNKENPRRAYYSRGVRVLDDMIIDHIAVARSHKPSNMRAKIAEAVFKTYDSQAEGHMNSTTFFKSLIELGEDITKTVSSAYFYGETEAAGDGDSEHVHEYLARFDGDTGTLQGYTFLPSAGERHTHLVDLMDDEPAATSGASRGADHKHNLGMPTVRQISENEYNEKLGNLLKENPEFTGFTFQKVDTMSDEKLDSSNETAAMIEATQKLNESSSIFASIVQMLKGSPLQTQSTTERLKGIILEMGRLDKDSEEYKNTVDTVLEVAKTLTDQDTIGAGDAPIKEEAASSGENEQPSTEGDEDMDAVKVEEILAKQITAMESRVTDSLLKAFKDQGLLVDTETDTEADVTSEPETETSPDANVSSTTDSEPEAQGESSDDDETEDDGTDETPAITAEQLAAMVTQALQPTIENVEKTVSSLRDRVDTLEGRPRQARSMQTHDTSTPERKVGGMFPIPATYQKK